MVDELMEGVTGYERWFNLAPVHRSAPERAEDAIRREHYWRPPTWNLAPDPLSTGESTERAGIH